MLRGFYAIVDVSFQQLGLDGELLCQSLQQQTEAILAAEPCMLQLRAKGATPAQLLRWALALKPLCRQRGVPFCVNDRLDVALAVGADAVHLGQDDLPLEAALRVLGGGPTMQIGISTHNAAQAVAAAAAGAHYLGFGPVFPTISKQNPDPVVGLQALAEVVKLVAIPVVAIGGITLESVQTVAKTGAAAAAVISAVLRAPDPADAGRQIKLAFEDASAG